MRRYFNPFGLLIVTAAVATPVLVKAAKPFAKKVGKGIKNVGEKLVESVEKMEAEERDRKESATARETTPDEPKSEAKEESTSAKGSAPTEEPKAAAEEAPKTETKAKAATTKVKQSKPAAKKRATKSTSKTVKAKRTTRRSAKDVGETG